MNRAVRGALALCLGFGCTLAAISIRDHSREPSASPGTKVGTLDMNQYCVTEYGQDAQAVHLADGAYGWRCWVLKNKINTPQEIDSDQACAVLYGAPAYAVSWSVDATYSWDCYRGPRAPGT